MLERIAVMAPNWLGDAVMALPAIFDIRRAFPSARLSIAARPSVAGLFAMVPQVDATVPVDQVADAGVELAILFPNSFASAWIARKAGIPERWGYRSDWRRGLLTRSVPRPPGSMHQGAYYQYLTRELGIDSGPLEPEISVPATGVESARGLLTARGWSEPASIVVFAPGAAYGTAKRWLPAYVARVMAELARQHSITCVMVGSAADRETTTQISRALPVDITSRVLDLTGQTTLEQLAGLLRLARACVANDSGAMHLAAAIGTVLVVPFGPTNEFETAPLTRQGCFAKVLTHPVWCRPCMLRECPIDHRCMKGITPERVLDVLNSTPNKWGRESFFEDSSA
jgi:heptosyltransferase-2